jgi:hypothetical protein
MPSSALEQYTMNYGQRLQTLLTPQVKQTIDTSGVLGREAAPPQQSALEQPQAPPQQQGPTPDQVAMQQDEEQQARDEAQQPQQPQQSALSPPAQPPGGPGAPAGKQGTSARKLFENLPDEEQEKQARDLADALKRGGKTIDQAYDELVKQMGTRPDESLDKKDKAMLLMEFGLNLMAQSAQGRHGADLTGAMGDAGLNSLDSYQRAKGAKAREWDARRSALDTGRVKDKLELGLAATGAEIKSDATLPREFAPGRDQISTFPGGDGFMHRMVNGKSEVVMEDGKPVRAPEKDLHTGGGGTEKVFEFDHRKKAYLQARGYDEKGDPMSPDVPELKGPEKRTLLQRATDYAGDTKNSALSDEEIMTQAQRSVDEHMRYMQDAYRDYTPAQLDEERKRLLKERVAEIKSGRTPSSLESPAAAPNPNNLGPLASPSTSPFETPGIPKAPPASILVEGKARKIKGFEGRWTLKNGQPVRVD